MADAKDEWRPGSFTKNFSWGRLAPGLQELHESIRIGFDGHVENVLRSTFRERVKATNRPDYIPINFFLFNRQEGGEDWLVADELVFQAITADHSERFDKLALFAFLLSHAGKFKGAGPAQRYPAMWANAYIRERVSADFEWNVQRISANDIQNFVDRDPRYKAETSRKLSTNLYFILQKGHLEGFSTKRIERWWVDSLFLALDRIIEDRLIDAQKTPENQYGSLLFREGFLQLTGGSTLEKRLAMEHLVRLYTACGGRSRFQDELVIERTKELLPEEEPFRPNDSRPRGAVHLTNPRILKSIPPICAMLVKYAGFVDIDPDELEHFDLEYFIQRQTESALQSLRREDIRPTMTAEEIMRITRER